MKAVDAIGPSWNSRGQPLEAGEADDEEQDELQHQKWRDAHPRHEEHMRSHRRFRISPEWIGTLKDFFQVPRQLAVAQAFAQGRVVGPFLFPVTAGVPVQITGAKEPNDAKASSHVGGDARKPMRSRRPTRSFEEHGFDTSESATRPAAPTSAVWRRSRNTDPAAGRATHARRSACRRRGPGSLR